MDVKPIYPEPALQARVQGVVILDVLVNTEGVPVDLPVVRTHALFESASVEAVKQRRWRPYLVDGQPVPFKVLVIVNFQLTTRR